MSNFTIGWAVFLNGLSLFISGDLDITFKLDPENSPSILCLSSSTLLDTGPTAPLSI